MDTDSQTPSVKPTSSNASPDSRCDNYPKYLRDTFGYAYDATDRVSLNAREQHFELLELSAPSLRELDRDDLDDFALLAVAHAWMNAGEGEEETSRFEAVIDEILAEPNDHPAVRYPEVVLLIAYTLADRGAPEVGLDKLEQHRGLFESEVDRREHALVRGRLLVQSGRSDEAEEAFASACDISDEAETHLDVATICARAYEDDLAREWLARAREMAEAAGDAALLVDIGVWEDRLKN